MPADEQLDLLRTPRRAPVDSVGPYRPDPPSVPVRTSEAASESMVGLTGQLRRRVFEHLELQGKHGATDEEIADALKLGLNTVRPRRRELVLIERVWDSSGRRSTRAGRSAIVWTAVRPSTAPEPEAEYEVCPRCRGAGRLRCG